jgi:hypothetical protein
MAAPRRTHRGTASWTPVRTSRQQSCPQCRGRQSHPAPASCNQAAATPDNPTTRPSTVESRAANSTHLLPARERSEKVWARLAPARAWHAAHQHSVARPQRRPRLRVRSRLGGLPMHTTPQPQQGLASVAKNDSSAASGASTAAHNAAPRRGEQRGNQCGWVGQFCLAPRFAASTYLHRGLQRLPRDPSDDQPAPGGHAGVVQALRPPQASAPTHRTPPWAAAHIHPVAPRVPHTPTHPPTATRGKRAAHIPSGCVA